MTTLRTLHCSHCGASNDVAMCEGCGRSFVVTAATVHGRERQFQAEPVAGLPNGFQPLLCGTCIAKDRGDLIGAVNAGLRDRTCAACAMEFLSAHGL